MVPLRQRHRLRHLPRRRGERWGEVLFLTGDSEREGENLHDRLLTLLCTDEGFRLIAFAAVG